MLRQLIRKALERQRMSMRQASRAAGMSETWVRDIVDGTIRDPGIAAVMRLASVLDIEPAQILEAVQQEPTVSKARSSVEAATRIVTQMTPEERAAFISANRRRQ
jgi:transcriptional regulator with XRE-family HTH domain